jgi:hypothetical protein
MYKPPLKSSHQLYLRVLEGLKNADPTFYRMMNAILKDKMQRNVFAYANDIVVASWEKAT